MYRVSFSNTHYWITTEYNAFDPFPFYVLYKSTALPCVDQIFRSKYHHESAFHKRLSQLWRDIDPERYDATSENPFYWAQ